MLDYTKMAIKQTISDLKKTDYIRNVATQIIYIIYLVYTLIVGAGYLALNIVLLVMSTSYFVFFLTMTSLGKTPEGKNVKKTGTTVYVWCKRLIKLFTLGLTIYGICTAVEHVSALSVVLAALMIVGWCLQIIFEVLIKILTNRVNFILEGLEADLDNMLKPVRSVGNFFKKVTGKEVAPQKEMTKNQLKLKEKVEAYRAEQKRIKAEEKIRREVERTAAKQTAKEQKREQKNSLRIENKLLKDADKQKRAEEKAAQPTERNDLEGEEKYLPSADSPTTGAETALALSGALEAESSKKPSLLRRIKAKLTGGTQTGVLPPEKEVFEEEDGNPGAEDDKNFYELDEEESADFFDEEQIPFLAAGNEDPGEADGEDSEEIEKEEDGPEPAKNEDDSRRQMPPQEKKNKRDLFSWLRKKGG